MKTVHIVGDFSSYTLMFEEQGWEVVDCIEDADLVQFCGGEDVWPGLYKERPLEGTSFNLQRDRYEKAMFNLAVEFDCAIAGICRGAQFVHVMNGGSLYQHVDNHALRNGHYSTLTEEFKDLNPNPLHCSSTHHQMMREGEGVVILHSKQSTIKHGQTGALCAEKHFVRDVEAMWHEETKSFCYQPHPEYHMIGNPCRVLYFRLMKRLILLKKEEKE